MTRIFISYRRIDSRLVSSRIYDRLVQAFGKSDIFKDIDNIPPGTDFRTVLEEATATCRIMLVIIGPEWLDTRDSTGQRRLDDPNDFVRLEIQAGLERNKTLVIPILVENAAMPAAQHLPLVLKKLSYKHAFTVGDDPRFHDDMGTLITYMRRHLAQSKQGLFDWRWVTGIIMTIILIAAAIITTMPHTALSTSTFTATLDFSALVAGTLAAEASYTASMGTPIPTEDIPATLAIMAVNTRNVEFTETATYRPTSSANPIDTATPTQIEASPTIEGNSTSIFADVGSQLMRVNGGTFMMGTEPMEVVRAVNQCIEEGGSCITDYASDSIPAHAVTVDDFLIEKTEVSYAQYVVFLNYLRSQGLDHIQGCGTTSSQRCIDIHTENANSPINRELNIYYLDQEAIVANTPAVYVTWYGAETYCRTLGRRLPTEAEWERAARGNSGFYYPWGNDWDPHNANVVGSTLMQSALMNVDSLPRGASEFGVLHMSGNAAEWVQDWYSPIYYSQEEQFINPTGPMTGVERVLRGGSREFRAFFARTVQRLSNPPDSRQAYTGFRCVRNLDENMHQ